MRTWWATESWPASAEVLDHLLGEALLHLGDRCRRHRVHRVPETTVVERSGRDLHEAVASGRLRARYVPRCIDGVLHGSGSSSRTSAR